MKSTCDLIDLIPPGLPPQTLLELLRGIQEDASASDYRCLHLENWTSP